MRILLPPSEAKAAGGRRAPAREVDAVLAAARAEVAAALATGLTRPDAATLLGLPTRSAADELLHNAAISSAPRLPALARYAGIVYQGLDAASLPAPARRRAGTSVLVMSGLYGVVRGDEPIPRYRVPAAAALPGIGGLAAFWRPVLTLVMPSLLSGLLIDLRSTDYTAMWKAPVDAVAVRVLSRRPSGPPVVVSYDSKLGKGRLTRALLSADRPARGVDDVLAAWTAAGGRDASVTGSRLDLVI